MEWTPKRAARFGWLAGRGASMATIMRDRQIRAESEQQLRGCATRWGLSFGSSSGASSSLAIPLPVADQEILEAAAQERGLSTASFAADLLHVITSQRLIRAVMDDEI